MNKIEKHPILEASLIIKKVMEITKRPSKDYVRLITLVIRGVNPFSKGELVLAQIDLNHWQELLNQLKK